ncbi:MAG: cobalt-precorrin 5A hydrolase [Lachnospiraceae bacterium]|nr:cobalt-precorrin 5A hydrolase [Lachnospiraceae bacterium]
MSLSIVSFTKNGINLSEKIAKTLWETEYRLFTKCSTYSQEKPSHGIQFVDKSIGKWAKEEMEKGNSLLFIGACGIAVRAIAPYITDKLYDSPVLVIDEKGRYLIPILSGHMGGANELAVFIGTKIGAEPVITTATDINQKFAVDMFAKKNELSIVNKDGIAKVSAKVLSGHNITISIEPGHFENDCKLPKGVHIVPYPPTQKVDVVVTSEDIESDTVILLKPKEYVIGMGCRKGKEAEKIKAFIMRSLWKVGISQSQIAKLASIDLKSNEPGLLMWSRKEKIPFITYTAKELQVVKGEFQTSDFVKEKIGVDNVCERAALKACEPEGKLIYKKHAEDGMTIAIAKREWRVKFDET